MGTKGRDLCLWLFFALALICVFSPGAARISIFVMSLLAVSYMYYCAWYLPGSVRKSRELGLRIVVLLPVRPLWAKILLRLDGEHMEHFCLVYEVHVRSSEQKLSNYLHYLQMLASDLEIAARMFPDALFLWETSAPLPLSIRRMIRHAPRGNAFLKKGSWRIPQLPFTGRDMKRGHIRHGAIINRKELVV